MRYVLNPAILGFHKTMTNTAVYSLMSARHVTNLSAELPRPFGAELFSDCEITMTLVMMMMMMLIMLSAGCNDV